MIDLKQYEGEYVREEGIFPKAVTVSASEVPEISAWMEASGYKSYSVGGAKEFHGHNRDITRAWTRRENDRQYMIVVETIGEGGWVFPQTCGRCGSLKGSQERPPDPAVPCGYCGKVTPYPPTAKAA